MAVLVIATMKTTMAAGHKKKKEKKSISDDAAKQIYVFFAAIFCPMCIYELIFSKNICDRLILM